MTRNPEHPGPFEEEAATESYSAAAERVRHASEEELGELVEEERRRDAE